MSREEVIKLLIEINNRFEGIPYSGIGWMNALKDDKSGMWYMAEELSIERMTEDDLYELLVDSLTKHDN
jgi:hypothetical protein